MESNIKDFKSLAKLLEFDPVDLNYILYVKRIDNFYTSFQIPKKSGGFRTIDAPNKELKSIHRALLNQIYEFQEQIKNQENFDPCHGFVKTRSIITNAENHRNKKYVLNIDISDFFPSFHFGRVRGAFNKKFNFPLDVSTVIANLTCYKGSLPQGASTSPAIANLIFYSVDMKILKLIKSYRLYYTRYADDMTFSTNDKKFLEKYDDFISKLEELLEKNGFNINQKKTRLQYNCSKQVVTGLVVNKKVNVDKNFYKKTRAMANSLYTENKFYIEKNEYSIDGMGILEGRFSFINQLDYYNNKLEKKNNNFRNLNAREREYQKFLFYKYFFNPSKPILITEGKTDIMYLKAALKNLYKDYPDLIEKNDDSFNFKIQFLKKTKRMEYFFGLLKNGLNNAKYIYNFYTNSQNKNFMNLSEYFNQKSNLNTKRNPVILIFDNEKDEKKPLKSFLNYLKITDFENYKKLVDNLYLLTCPLPDVKKEAEIEDLFNKETWAVELGDKTFNREEGFNENKHFGKKIFASYIIKNYKKIDFEGFKEFLDNLNKIIQSR